MALPYSPCACCGTPDIAWFVTDDATYQGEYLCTDCLAWARALLTERPWNPWVRPSDPRILRRPRPFWLREYYPEAL